MQEIKKGSVCVSDEAEVVVVSRTNVRSDSPDNFGRIHTYNVGTVLRSRIVPPGSRYAGKTLRFVCQIEDLLRLAEASGLDLTTPAEVPDSELSELELLQRKVAQLEQTVVLPRIGIAALQPQK